MSKKRLSVLGLALGALVLGVLVGLMTVGTVAADPTPGVKIQLPRIDIGDVLETGDWETWVQVQNVSLPDPVTGVEPDTGAIFLGWGDYSGLCPTNDPGVIAHYCGLIKGNALWTLRTQLNAPFPESVKSAIIYSVSPDVFQEACTASALTEGDKVAWKCWVDEWSGKDGGCEDAGGGWNDGPGGAQGEDLAVTATRYGPNDHGTFVSSTYTGISEEMEGVDHPYEYYAPYIMKGYNGLDTELTIQNSGDACTSVWLHYKQEGTCTTVYSQHIEQLAPGEAVRVKAPDPQLPCFWLGSAHITAEQPLGIVVDETSFEEPCLGPDPGTLLTHRARSKKETRDGVDILDYKVYADLTFREWSGWDTSIQVQNLSRTGQNTFVTVDFMDNSGDEILFLADWVCPADSTTFYLPIVTDLGFNYIGAAEIQSHDQVSFPGEVTDAQPIFAVVDLKRPDDPFTPDLDAQGGSYNAHPYSQKEWVSEIALPFMAKDAQDMYTPWTSMIAIRNNSNCNKIKPKIWFKIETGQLVCELQLPWLHPKHSKLIDLNDIGCLVPGYVGSAKVIVEEFEQLCDVDGDGRVDNEPLMPSVIVVEKGVGGIGGDITNIYEGIPYATNIPLCYGDVKGNVYSELGKISENPMSEPFPLHEATVEVVDYDPAKIDVTDSTGWYQITDVIEGTYEIKAYDDGFATCTSSVDIPCNDQVYKNFELRCADIDLGVFVTQEDGGSPVQGADVHVDFSLSDHACVDDKDLDAETAVTGWYTFTNALQLQAGEAVAITVSKDGYDTKVVTPTTATDFYACPGTATYTTTLCGYFTLYGKVWDGTNPYIGYTVKAEGKDTSAMVTPDQPDGDVTDSNGNYALGVSVKDCSDENGYFLRVYTSSGVLVHEKAVVTCSSTDCGDLKPTEIKFP